MKLPDWDVRLMLWAEEVRHAGFQWGVRDCAQLCLDAWSIMTGRDHPHRGQYASERQAVRYQRSVATIQTALLDLGCAAVPAAFRQRGDFILVRDRTWRVGNVCMGELSLSANPELGVIAFPTELLLDQPELLVLRIA